MKTRRLWAHFIVHSFKREWVWKPTLLRSQTIFNSGSKMWLAPHLEFCWLFLVLQWTFYSRKKEYKGNYFEHECPAEAMQDRINVLENAIRNHQKHTGELQANQKDKDLWSALN